MTPTTLLSNELLTKWPHPSATLGWGGARGSRVAHSLTSGACGRCCGGGGRLAEREAQQVQAAATRGRGGGAGAALAPGRQGHGDRHGRAHGGGGRSRGAPAGRGVAAGGGLAGRLALGPRGLAGRRHHRGCGRMRGGGGDRIRPAAADGAEVVEDGALRGGGRLCRKSKPPAPLESAAAAAAASGSSPALAVESLRNEKPPAAPSASGAPAAVARNAVSAAEGQSRTHTSARETYMRSPRLPAAAQRRRPPLRTCPPARKRPCRFACSCSTLAFTSAVPSPEAAD